MDCLTTKSNFHHSTKMSWSSNFHEVYDSHYFSFHSPVPQCIPLFQELQGWMQDFLVERGRGGEMNQEICTYF